MGKAVTDNCKLGCGRPGTFCHTIWESQIIQVNWACVITCIGEVVEKRVEASARWCLLNIWDESDLIRMEKIWVTLGLAGAKCNIGKL